MLVFDLFNLHQSGCAKLKAMRVSTAEAPTQLCLAESDDAACAALRRGRDEAAGPPGASAPARAHLEAPMLSCIRPIGRRLWNQLTCCWHC